MVFQIGDYTVFELLGTGSYSKVYRAHHSKMRQDCALKVIDVSTYSEEDLLFLHREIEIVRDLQHPNIIKVYESFVSQNYVCISMELCERGTVLEYVNNCGPLHPAEVKALFHQMVSAVQYLHKTCGVIHRDLKCENWMLSSSRSVKLIDFGFARRVIKGELLSTLCGSLHYTAPELIKGEEYTNLIDVWSLGVILYAMATGQLPWTKRNKIQLFGQIKRGNYTIPQTLSAELRDLIARMMTVDPSKRIDINSALNHPFLADVSLTKEQSKCDIPYVSLRRVDELFHADVDVQHGPIKRQESSGHLTENFQKLSKLLHPQRVVQSQPPSLAQSRKTFLPESVSFMHRAKDSSDRGAPADVKKLLANCCMRRRQLAKIVRPKLSQMPIAVPTE